MQELMTGVNWISVLVGGVAAFLMGWLWYSPALFGKKWADDQGLGLGSASEMPVAAMATNMIGLLLLSWFVAVTAASNLLFTLILAVLAFTCLGFSGGLFIKQSGYVRMVNAGYWLVSVVVMIIVQAIF